MFSATSSTRPRVFINAPSENESFQFIPINRDASMTPPSLPVTATAMMPPQISQLPRLLNRPR